MTDTSAAARFASKYRIDPATNCWVWTASLRKSGYTQFHLGDKKNGYGHIFSYQHYVGPISPGNQIHHVCENKACVNPAHLEQVAPRVHILERNDTPARRNAAKTHCKRGHPLSGENLYVYAKTGRRSCRECMRMHQKAFRESNPEKQSEYQRRYLDLHPEAVERNRERAREWNREHPRERDPEKEREYQRRYRERLREDAKKWRESQKSE